MKKILLSILTFVFCLPPLSSCDRSGTIENLQVHGSVNGVTSLNPLLTWEGSENEKYSITINNISDKNEEVIKNVTSPFSLGGYLDLDTKYEVLVAKNRKKNGKSVIFSTMKEGSNKMDSVDSYPMVFGAYSDNMIIQRDKPFLIKGYAKKGVQVSVLLDDEVYTTLSEGNWEIQIPAHSGSNESKVLRIITSNKREITYKNISFGDVFLVAGQSNIQWPIKDADYNAEDLEIDPKMVRFFAQTTVNSKEKAVKFLDGRWFIYDKNDAGNQLYSAICLMLGSMLAKELKESNVPIGIMYAAQGDTAISQWMDESFYKGNDVNPGIFYNTMVHPFNGLNVKGVVWYQGCNDSSKSIEYTENLKSLFECYRKLFSDEKLPFFVVQLPCFDGDSGNKFSFAYVRDSQYKACLDDENAYLISTCDGGDPSYIHPREKRYISERLTKSILAVCFSKGILKESPTVKKITFNKNDVVVELNNSSGLHSETCKGFVLAGENGKFEDATARIEGERIIVSSNMENPKYIRYGFSRSPFLDIYNKDGYLMSPFRSDDFDRNIDIFDYKNADLYNKDSGGGECRISLSNGSLMMEKLSSSDDYCALNLDRWAPVNHTGSKFRVTYKGINSKNVVQIRFIESSYEIWAFSFVDDSTEEKNIEFVREKDLKCVYNDTNNKFDYQSIMQVGILIKGPNSSKIEIKEARFI